VVEADLSDAKLVSANLSYTDLRGATLIGVDLSGADLHAAILSGVAGGCIGTGGIMLPNSRPT
jgi:uncharacterized protein YjbI with pentapeptide repeats